MIKILFANFRNNYQYFFQSINDAAKLQFQKSDFHQIFELRNFQAYKQ